MIVSHLAFWRREIKIFIYDGNKAKEASFLDIFTFHLFYIYVESDYSFYIFIAILLFSINPQSISIIIRGNYIFCSRERVSSERRVGGSISDRARDTCVGDRDPRRPWRVVEHMPIRMHSGGPLLSGYRTNVNHHCRGELHSFVSASRKVRARNSFYHQWRTFTFDQLQRCLIIIIIITTKILEAEITDVIKYQGWKNFMRNLIIGKKKEDGVNILYYK